MRQLIFAVLVLACSACDCNSKVGQIKPVLSLTPVGIDFGQVKNGDTAFRTLTFTSGSQTPVVVSGVKLEAGSAPGGVEGFSLGMPPTTIDALDTASLRIGFSPTVLQLYKATLVVSSNDSESPTMRVALVGEGAKPILEVTPECVSLRGCTDSVTVAPPSIDFGAEPLTRATPVDASKLPTVNIVNSGPVALNVTKASFAGADATAFSFAGNSVFPDGGVLLEASEGRSLQIQFKPTSAVKASYQAQLVIESDDVELPSVVVELKGQLLPNQPPVICANLIRAVPGTLGDGPRDYGSAAQWAALQVPPATGYDFSVARDVRPGDLAVFSALSDATDVTTCTSDPEDGRTGLTFAWRLVTMPLGVTGLTISGAATSQAQLRPSVTGDYLLELSVKDSQLAETKVLIRFSVAIKQDLVAQLQWVGFNDIDLDVHLVRPGSLPFSFFSEGSSAKTSGDINGFAVGTVKAMPGAGFNFDWGSAGSADDPTLNVDDKGLGALLENVSLNFPENAPECATSSCTYGVYVHYFKDQRVTSPLACIVDGGVGCRDGQRCGCAMETERCVAESAPAADAGVGAGKCFVAPQPVLRIFLRGATEPAKIVPLDSLMPPDLLAVGAPCQLLHIADIAWPAKSLLGSLPDGGTPAPVITVPGADGSGRVTAPAITRYGYRQSGGSLQCSPDYTAGTTQWYSEQP